MGLLDKADDKMHELKGRAEQKIKDSKADDKKTSDNTTTGETL